MTRIGVVLGAGGVVGQAYHAGVLAVLEHDHGFDARAADVLVGTSAGSITATLLRLGVSAADLAAWTVRAPLSEDRPLHRRMATTVLPELAPFRPLSLLRRPPRPPGPAMIRAAVLRPLRFRPLAAALALVAAGRHDIVAQLGALREVEQASWPQDPLWICAVRRQDGRRVIFGRPGAPAAPVHLAAAASCAVPGYFAPVRIGDRTYVDGGVHSPTNAATLRAEHLDLVVVISPMSGPPGPLPDLYAASRRHSARLLRREVRALEAAGTRTLVFSPGPAEQRVMGNDMMSRRRINEVIQRSFLDAGAYAARPEVRSVLREAVAGREPARR